MNCKTNVLHLEVLDQLTPRLVPVLSLACPGFTLDPGTSNNPGRLGVVIQCYGTNLRSGALNQSCFWILGKRLHLGECVRDLPPVHIVLFPIYFQHLNTTIRIYDLCHKNAPLSASSKEKYNLNSWRPSSPLCLLLDWWQEPLSPTSASHPPHTPSGASQTCRF